MINGPVGMQPRLATTSNSRTANCSLEPGERGVEGSEVFHDIVDNQLTCAMLRGQVRLQSVSDPPGETK